jgi:hypothetical protein
VRIIPGRTRLTRNRSSTLFTLLAGKRDVDLDRQAIVALLVNYGERGTVGRSTGWSWMKSIAQIWLVTAGRGLTTRR